MTLKTQYIAGLLKLHFQEHKYLRVSQETLLGFLHEQNPDDEISPNQLSRALRMLGFASATEAGHKYYYNLSSLIKRGTK